MTLALRFFKQALRQCVSGVENALPRTVAQQIDTTDPIKDKFPAGFRCLNR